MHHYQHHPTGIIRAETRSVVLHTEVKVSGKDPLGFLAVREVSEVIQALDANKRSDGIRNADF